MQGVDPQLGGPVQLLQHQLQRRSHRHRASHQQTGQGCGLRDTPRRDGAPGHHRRSPQRHIPQTPHHGGQRGRRTHASPRLPHHKPTRPLQTHKAVPQIHDRRRQNPEPTRRVHHDPQKANHRLIFFLMIGYPKLKCVSY